MSDAWGKAFRLVEMMDFIRARKEFTTREIAERLSVHVRTARRYLSEASGMGVLPIYRHGRGWKVCR